MESQIPSAVLGGNELVDIVLKATGGSMVLIVLIRELFKQVRWKGDELGEYRAELHAAVKELTSKVEKLQQGLLDCERDKHEMGSQIATMKNEITYLKKYCSPNKER